MATNLISIANNIYQCAEELSVIPKEIDFPELHNYINNIRTLQHHLRESSNDEDWKQIIRQLKYLSFLLTAIPLSHNELNSELSLLVGKLANKQRICEIQYPSVFPYFQNVSQSLGDLMKCQLDLLRCRLEGLLSELEGRIGVVINRSKYIPKLNGQFGKTTDIIVSRQLAALTIYENIILIGTIDKRWFPEYILSAPRSKNIYSLYFKWFHSQWKTNNIFPNPLKGENEEGEDFREINVLETEDFIDPEFILPEFDFSLVISKAKNSYDEFTDDDEFVEAIIAYLENDQIVFLDIGDSSEIRIIDVEDEENPIKKIKTKDIVQDMFVLLKTSGGGDYIVPIADKIMGIHASELRSTQKKWKNGLRYLYNKNGCDWLENELKLNGCKIANYVNIHNWMSYRSIKTQKFDHFKAILEVVGLNESPGEIWKKMNLITQAHRKAGHYIQNLLLNEAKAIDFDDLVSQGIMEFVLPDKDAGSITAFRIKALSQKSETILVSPNKINIPMEIDE